MDASASSSSTEGLASFGSSNVLNQANESEVDLFVGCSNLPHSNNVVALYVGKQHQVGEAVQFDLLGVTSPVLGSKDPAFGSSFRVSYTFSATIFLRFEVFHLTNQDCPEDLSRQERVGLVDTTMSQVVGSRRKRFSGVISFSLSGIHLKKSSFWSSPDPFFEIWRDIDRRDGKLVYRSEVQESTRDPEWDQVKMKMARLCRGDLDTVLHIKVWDWKKRSKNKQIGYAELSAAELLQPDVEEVPLLHTKKEGKVTGTLRIGRSEVKQNASILDFVAGGCEISLLLAVDFTASNGEPHERDSLHFMHPSEKNPYEQAIRAIGNILIDYDSTKRVPAWGFGGKPTSSRTTSHCFPLNGNLGEPECGGIQGVMDAYHYSVQTTTLNGPTLLAPTLENVLVNYIYPSSVSQRNQRYFVLLVITDGVLDDMQETIDHIVEASTHPLSVVIVGVGSEDWREMDKLDADEVPLVDSKGVSMSRDIVNFVPFEDFKNLPKEKLAEKTLEEIPRQFLSFFASRGIVPNDPMQWQEQSSNSLSSFDCHADGGPPLPAPNQEPPPPSYQGSFSDIPTYQEEEVATPASPIGGPPAYTGPPAPAYPSQQGSLGPPPAFGGGSAAPSYMAPPPSVNAPSPSSGGPHASSGSSWPSSNPGYQSSSGSASGGGGGGGSIPSHDSGDLRSRQTELQMEEALRELQAMGFSDRSANEAALVACKGRVGLAIDMLSQGGQQQPPQQQPPQQQPHRYASELETLHSMGFADDEKNVRALDQSEGKVNQAVDWLFANS